MTGEGYQRTGVGLQRRDSGSGSGGGAEQRDCDGDRAWPSVAERDVVDPHLGAWYVHAVTIQF